jgi:hypothetical protein
MTCLTLENTASTLATAKNQAIPWLEQDVPLSASWLKKLASTFTTTKNQAILWLEHDMPTSEPWLKDTAAAENKAASYDQISFSNSYMAELNLLHKQVLTELMQW